MGDADDPIKGDSPAASSADNSNNAGRSERTSSIVDRAKQTFANLFGGLPRFLLNFVMRTLP